MSAQSNAPVASTPLDLSKWRKVPTLLIGAGGLLALIGLFVSYRQFSYAWLQAFMFFLSLCLGGLFMVLVHHLFDASWSVPIRRCCEHIAALAPWLALLFLPVLANALLAGPSGNIYGWISKDPHTDHALHSKLPLLTRGGFVVVTVFCFAVWWYFSRELRRWSLRQDETGSVECTYRMRKLSYYGIFLFAITLTLGAIMWMKSLHHQWFSTMYGVYYFAGSVWLSLAAIYLITVVLSRQGYLRGVVHEETFYYIGSLMLAFTVFYAYIHFAQYFVIWNANVPEETFWYKLRERGTWWDVGMIIVFGHFFVPFLALLRIDVKVSWLMYPICLWAGLMHYFDLSFNVMPVAHPEGFPIQWLWLDLGCLAFMAGLLAKAFLKQLNAHPAFPQKDPRMAESLGLYVPPASAAGSAATQGGAK